MRRSLTLILLASTLAVTACSKGGMRGIRAPGSGPDEFAISPAKPLTAPKDYASLPPPTPGGSNLTDPTPQADAVVALGGRASALDVTGVAASDGALVAAASRYGVPENVRTVVAEEDADYRKRRGRFTSIRLFKVDRYAQVYRPQTLDAGDQTALWRRAGAATPSAPPN